MDPRNMMGFDIPGDQRVPVPVRDWNAMKLAVWRSRVGWKIAEDRAMEIIASCRHADGCQGKDIETAPCLSGCPDREYRMSALVILNAARMFAPVHAPKPADAPYYAPSREYFSDVLAELAGSQVEILRLREMLRAAGIEPSPPSPDPALPPSASVPAQLEEKTS
jgi:hypothetical protein